MMISHFMVNKPEKLCHLLLNALYIEKVKKERTYNLGGYGFLSKIRLADHYFTSSVAGPVRP